MKNCKLLLLPLMILLFACEPDEQIVEPQVEKLEITLLEIPEAGGVKIKAKYSGSLPIANLETGFLFSRLPNPTLPGALNFPARVSGNELNLETDKEFNYNSQYYVIGYVKSDSGILYSSMKDFISTGSIMPQVYEMEKGRLQDTVHIHGRHFTKNMNYISVLFDGRSAMIVNSNDTLISCIVPGNLQKFNPDVKIGVFGKTVDYNNFSLFAPSITGFAKNTAGLSDTLTIYGKHFDFQTSRNKILVDQKVSTILNSSRDSITFILPSSLTVSTNTVTLISQLQETTSAVTFKINKPVVNTLPESFRTYETIEITGEGFSTERLSNNVYFEDNLGEVLAASVNKLTVRVPLGPYRNRNPQVRLELMDYSVPYDKNILLTDVWLQTSKLTANIDTRGSQYFVHNNLGYTLERDYENSRFKFYVLNPETESWSHFFVPYPRAGIQTEDVAIAYNKQSGRIFFYFSAAEKNFYEFSLQSRTFSLKADYPGVARALPAVFSIGNKINLGLGRIMDIYADQTSLSHFWSYNVNTNAWDQMAKFPLGGYRTDMSVVVIGNNAYLGNGAMSTGNDDFWKYSAASNTWEQIADFPGARTYTSFFDYDGKLYVYFGGSLSGDPGDTAFRYDPGTNAWSILEKVNDRYFNYFISPEASIALRFENAVYLGLTMYPHVHFFKADLNRLKQ